LIKGHAVDGTKVEGDQIKATFEFGEMITNAGLPINLASFDRLAVKCGKAGSVDLRYSGSHSLIEASLPQSLEKQVTTFKRGADIFSTIAQSCVEGLGTLCGVKVQVSESDDGFIVWRCPNGPHCVAHRGTGKNQEARGQNGGPYQSRFDPGFVAHVNVPGEID
jgi:hypothetical protein